MFLDNIYTKEYYKIIENNKLTVKGNGYVEKHHIIPRSLGGGNKKENIVFLPASVHFRCHQLLVEMTTDTNNGKMWNALWRMMNKQSRNQNREYTFTAEEYNVARTKHSEIHSALMSGENNPFFGKHHTSESLTKMSSAKKGKTYEEIFGEDYAKQMREKRSAEQLGIKKGKQHLVTCPHCSTVGGFGIMKRWHGDNCRSRK